MKHKDINQLEDANLKKIMRLIKKLENNQKKLHKIFKKDENNESNERSSI